MLTKKDWEAFFRAEFGVTAPVASRAFDNLEVAMFNALQVIGVQVPGIGRIHLQEHKARSSFGKEVPACYRPKLKPSKYAKKFD